MKKTMRRLFALVLALALVCGLSLQGAIANEQAVVTIMPQAAGATLYADSAESLGISTAVRRQLFTASYGTLDEYVLVSKYFIFDESLQPYLTENVSPEVFNLFMARMDLGYEAMVDLMGREPCNGAIITFIAPPPEHDYGYQWVYGGSPYIYWNTRYITRILSGFQSQDAGDWWFEGSMHELGHVFDDDGGDKWNFASEGMASFKAFLAMAKCGGYSSAWGTGWEILDSVWDDNLAGFTDMGTTRSFLTNNQDDIIFLVKPLFDALGTEAGWAVLQQVFRSYYDDSFQSEYQTLDQKEKQLDDFIDRISFFMEEDIKDYWLPETTQRFQTEITENISALTEMKIVLSPQNPKVGDALTLSVYNYPQQENATIFLWRGGTDSGYISSVTQQVQLAEGNNLNIPMGYTVMASDVEKDFIVRFDTPGDYFWSNWTARARAITGSKVMLDKDSIGVGSTSGLQWLGDEPEQKTCQWQRSKNNWDFTDIDGATLNQYVAQQDDFNYFIRCVVQDSVLSQTHWTNTLRVGEAILYPVTVTNDGNGTASASPADATAGTEITLTAVPNSGYQFKEWQVLSGGVTIADSKFSMPEGAVEVKAIFELIPQPTYAVTVTNDGNGTASASPADATAGTEITLIAAPNSGYQLKEWQVLDGGVTIADSKFSMPEGAVKVKAIFELIPQPPVVDKTTLDNRITELGNKPNDNYTPDSWNDFQEALDTARGISDNPGATQEQVNSALSTLNSTYNALKKNDTTKYIWLWGKQTRHVSNFINWLLCIFCFGWIWMAF